MPLRYLNNTNMINSYIINNKGLARTKFITHSKGITPLLKDSGGHMVNAGFLQPGKVIRIFNKTIRTKNRLRIIEAQVGSQRGWIALNRVGVPFFGFSFKRYGDTFIDELNANVATLKRAGAPNVKLYINSISPANLLLNDIYSGTLIKKKSAVCQYKIEGKDWSTYRVSNDFVYIRNVNDSIPVKVKDCDFFKFFITDIVYGFVGPDKVLQTHISKALTSSRVGPLNLGKILCGKDFSPSGECSENNAELVFFNGFGMEMHSTGNEYAIILRPNPPPSGVSSNSITYAVRNHLPDAKNFVVLAEAVPGKNIMSPKVIKGMQLSVTFRSLVEADPKIIKLDAMEIPPTPPTPPTL